MFNLITKPDSNYNESIQDKNVFQKIAMFHPTQIKNLIPVLIRAGITKAQIIRLLTEKDDSYADRRHRNGTFQTIALNQPEEIKSLIPVLINAGITRDEIIELLTNLSDETLQGVVRLGKGGDFINVLANNGFTQKQAIDFFTRKRDTLLLGEYCFGSHRQTKNNMIKLIDTLAAKGIQEDGLFAIFATQDKHGETLLDKFIDSHPNSSQRHIFNFKIVSTLIEKGKIKVAQLLTIPAFVLRRNSLIYQKYIIPELFKLEKKDIPEDALKYFISEPGKIFLSKMLSECDLDEDQQKAIADVNSAIGHIVHYSRAKNKIDYGKTATFKKLKKNKKYRFPEPQSQSVMKPRFRFFKSVTEQRKAEGIGKHKPNKTDLDSFLDPDPDPEEPSKPIKGRK